MWKKTTRIAYATGNLSDGYFELIENAFRIIRGTDSIPPNEVYIPSYRISNDEYIPITEIGKNDDSNGVFSNRTSITTVHIPDTVEIIRGGAFYGCTGLSSIIIPKSVTQITDFYYVFLSCTSLTSINVDNNNQIYSSEGGILYNKEKTQVIKAPQGISGHVNIPEGVMSFDSFAFQSCKNITNITLPESLTSIGWTPFRFCSSLTSITIPERVTIIGENSFDSCTNLENITILGIATIGNSAFVACNNLKSISILDVTVIGNNVFSSPNLISINVGNNLVDFGNHIVNTRYNIFWTYYQSITAEQRAGTYLWNGTSWTKN